MANEETEKPGWFQNEKTGSWAYFDGTTTEYDREPPASIRVAANLRREQIPSGPVTEPFSPWGAVKGIAGAGLRSLTGIPSAIGSAVTTAPLETAKALGRGVVEEAPALLGGIAGALAGGLPTAGIGAIPGAMLGAAGGKGWQKTIRGLTQGQASPEATQTPTEAVIETLSPAAETLALPGLGKLAKGGVRSAIRHLPGSELERGTMAVEKVRRGAQAILPKTPPEKATGLYQAAEKAGAQVGLTADSPLGVALRNSLEALHQSDPMRWPLKQPMSLDTAILAYQDIQAQLSNPKLAHLARRTLKRAFEDLDTQLTQSGGAPAATFREAGQAFKESATAQEVMDFINRRGAAFTQAGAGEKLTTDRLLNALKSPGAGEQFTWDRLRELDPTALARIEDLVREQALSGLVPQVASGNPLSRAAIRFGLPVGVGGATMGGPGAIIGFAGARGLQAFSQTPFGRALIRGAWDRPHPFEVPFGLPAAGVGLGSMATGGNR